MHARHRKPAGNMQLAPWPQMPAPQPGGAVTVTFTLAVPIFPFAAVPIKVMT